MRLEQTPRTEQTVRVSARLVTSSTILHLSADELERTINQEQTENPVLEVTEQRICLFCSTPLYGQSCTVCGRFTQNMHQLGSSPESRRQDMPLDGQWEPQTFFYDSDNYGFAEADDDFDPMAHIATGETLTEDLLQQLEAQVSPDDALIAEQLVGNLNARGYLEMGLQEIANHLQIPYERVAYVLSRLQMLEPSGIGARNLRECLLIQLEAISEQQTPHPLAYPLIDRYLEDLGHNRYADIARRLMVTEQEVRQAVHYIRSTLHPYPGHMYRSSISDTTLGNGIAYIHPDIIIRRGENGFEVELTEEKRYNFRVDTHYSGQPGETTSDVQRYMHQNRDRASFFVDCIHRRWRTLKRVANIVISHQKDFLEKGIRYLYPLTRSEVALQLHLDEGTVSRATANKYALLPNGRLIPIADFFDGSLRIKDMLRELIHAESAQHRLSDEELAKMLTTRGIPLARRTITKYREEMGIGSSRERS